MEHQETALTVQGLREGYFSLPGLSNSGMADLAVSPLRYWHLHINPDRPIEEPTPAMVFGSALHCALFEPRRFEAEYAPKLDLSACDGVLETIADIREWMLVRGVKAKGSTKAGVIEQAMALDPGVLIADVLVSEHAVKHAGKMLLPIEAWNRIVGCIEALRAEPVINEILNDPDGRAEVPMRVEDPGTGVLLKARMDWVTPKLTFDLKTFSQKRKTSIDKSVVDAIYYEDYLRQAWFYTYIRTLLEPGSEKPFVIGLVESEPPHEVRVRVLRGTTAGEPNIYWHRARTQVIGIGGRGGLVDLYADCRKRFGDKPWKTEATMDPLIDDEMPQLAFER